MLRERTGINRHHSTIYTPPGQSGRSIGVRSIAGPVVPAERSVGALYHRAGRAEWIVQDRQARYDGWGAWGLAGQSVCCNIYPCQTHRWGGVPVSYWVPLGPSEQVESAVKGHISKLP